ncbi:thiamine phosphate synthase [Bartonella ancashensis]|uniref:Thiamin-phosphate pyrophosphorylase n=1 Tax=Bartonella ancashensis TaxID=1318743 RepID=A0A0M3T2M8_9HYPH|nr:thiamine phosphate synthase [Bartonella ancashensis]ALE03121.1 Thiamin-phosphate pyrophosphorylase [Bartonella ancashensis]
MVQYNKEITASHLYPQLVLTVDVRRNLEPSYLHSVLQTGFFPCVIVYDSLKCQGDEFFLQKEIQRYGDAIQQNGAALIVVDDSRIAGRVKADGIHFEGDIDACQNFKDRAKEENKIIGFGNIRDRHTAMVVAESGVDYLFFGKLGADKKPHAHSRNLSLARWWAEIMEIPAIIQAGSDEGMVDEAIKTACEFIAIEEMIFAHENAVALLGKIVQKCRNAPLPRGRILS